MIDSTRSLLLRNALSQSLGQALSRLLGLLFVPWIFAYLGVEGSAVYCLGLATIGLAPVLDPGLQFGLARAFSDRLARGRHADIHRMMTLSQLAYLLYGAALTGAAWLAMPWLLAVAGVPESLRGAAAPFFLVLFVALAFRNLSHVHFMLLIASQRMALANLLFAIGSLAHYGLVAAAILLDKGLPAIGLGFLAGDLARGILYRAFARRGLGREGTAAARRALLMELAAFGNRQKVAELCDILVFHADKYFLAHFLGPRAVGFYFLGAQFAMALRDFLKLASRALLPLLTGMASSAPAERLRRANREASRWYAAAVTPFFLFTALAAPWAIHAWSGEARPESALALALLALASWVNIAPAPSWELADGMGLPGLRMRAGIRASLANLALNLALVQVLGFAGVGLASILSFGVGSLLFLRALLGRVGDRTGPFLGRVLARPALAGALAALVTWPLMQLLPASGGRLAALGALLGLGPVFLLVYGGGLLALGQVTRADWARLRGRQEPEALGGQRREADEP